MWCSWCIYELVGLWRIADTTSDLRLPFHLYTSLPCDHYQNCIATEVHLCVNNLPNVVACQWHGMVGIRIHDHRFAISTSYGVFHTGNLCSKVQQNFVKFFFHKIEHVLYCEIEFRKWSDSKVDRSHWRLSKGDLKIKKNSTVTLA